MGEGVMDALVYAVKMFAVIHDALSFVKQFCRLKSASTAVGYQRGLCLQRSPAHTAKSVKFKFF
jgi:membrane-anchored glycerophosphoryl diester phosphodiesterase (GDPDase)